MVPSKAWQVAQTSGSKKALLELCLLEGDEEGFADQGREEVPLLKPVLLEGNEEGCAETQTVLLESDEEGCDETLGRRRSARRWCPRRPGRWLRRVTRSRYFSN
jgi:hypothetical protein